MECNWCSSLLASWLSIVSLSSLSLLFLTIISWKSSRNGATKRRPPGPPGWPVFGNIFDLLGTMPHQNLSKLKSKYGPVLWLRLGSVNTMVVQSAKAAEELFKKHDLAFCDRKVSDAVTAWNYNRGSLAFGNYGDNWRTLRRLCTAELLASKRIGETAPLRRKCVDKMVRWIEEDSTESRAKGGSGEVEIGRFFFLMAFNVVGNLMLSRDLLEPNSDEGVEFFDGMGKFMEWAGKPNVADFFPFLKWMDPQGIRRSMVRDLGGLLKIAGEFVKERVRQKELGIERTSKDFLDAVLKYEGDEGKEGPRKISERDAIIIVLDMFFGGSETSSSTIEWAMAELLRNPVTMKEAKEELDRVIGPNRKVEESDMDELPYLQAVVKETFRLYPGLPLLIPRNTMEDSNFMGYFIPKNTQVMVNAYAIGRDPESWDDPLSFKPERFLGKDIGFKGQNFELIPFGSGRRICIGYALAHQVIRLALATLLQTFDWELGETVTSNASLDMSERIGISLRKLVPLKAIPTKRASF